MDAAAPLYADFAGLTRLKAKSVADKDGSAAEVARQFESLLIGQMVKSMRQANLGEGILDSDQSLFYRDMFDQQLALHLAENGGIGLAEAIQRQLEGARLAMTGEGKSIASYFSSPTYIYAAEKDDDTMAELAADKAKGPANSAAEADSDNWSSNDFVRHLWPWAKEAANRIGLQPQALLAQAALETGWGQRMLTKFDGQPSHNLFGIKADRRWQGEKVNVATLEYEEGSAVKRRQAFRSYDSFRQSFNDYVDFLSSNPRYQQALASTSNSSAYFSELQKAGYATDPNYADKINAVLHGREMSRALRHVKTLENQPL